MRYLWLALLLIAVSAHAQTTMMFGRGNNGVNVHDAFVRGNSASWVPPFTTCPSNVAGVSARRFLFSGLYYNDLMLLCWDTTNLPAGANVSSATVTLQANGQGTYGGNLVGDWYNFGAGCDTADYTTSVLDGSSVPSTAVSGFTNNVDKVIALANVATHIVSGTVCIRIGGEQSTAPVGLDNGVIVYSNAQSSTREALLTVVFTVGTVTPTPTSVATQTPTPTNTSAITPTAWPTYTPATPGGTPDPSCREHLP